MILLSPRYLSFYLTSGGIFLRPDRTDFNVDWSLSSPFSRAAPEKGHVRRVTGGGHSGIGVAVSRGRLHMCTGQVDGVSQVCGVSGPSIGGMTDDWKKVNAKIGQTKSESRANVTR